MQQQFTAEIKKYDPDFEDGATFDTWEEAEQWLLNQRQYGLFSMWINNQHVRFFNGNVVYDELARVGNQIEADAQETVEMTDRACAEMDEAIVK